MRLDYHQAMTNESIQRQLFNVTTPDEFKKDIAERGEQQAYSTDVQVWMLPANPPCQAFPIRRGNHREIVVLPLFTEAWYQRAKLKTFVVPPIWEMCKVLSYTLTGLVRQKGVKFPRYPFVVVLDPHTRLGDNKPLTIYTPDPKVVVPGITNVTPNQVYNNNDMLREVKRGEQERNNLRLVKETDAKGKSRWFWETISYLSAMRLMGVSYPEGDRPTFTCFGEIDHKLVTMELHKISEDFGDILSRFVSDYLDKPMMVRYCIKPGGFELYGDNALLTGAVCGPFDTTFELPENNRIITY